jgi:hypothetical protein
MTGTPGRPKKPVMKPQLSDQQVAQFWGLVRFYDSKPTTGGDYGVRGTGQDPRQHRLHGEPTDDPTAAQEVQSRSPEDDSVARPTDHRAK